MQLSNNTSRPWPLPQDLDFTILSYLNPKDCFSFSQVSKSCLKMINKWDEPLFASSILKPERFKELSWRQIAANRYSYPKSDKHVLRSENSSDKDSRLERIGQMICLRNRKGQRLIDYRATIFRVFSLDEKIIHTSFLSALVFRKGRYEIYDRHLQTPIKMPEGVDVDPSYPALMCFQGEKAAIVVSLQGKKRLVFADRRKAALLEGDLDQKAELYSLDDWLAVINGLSVKILGFEGETKKTFQVDGQVKRCAVSTGEFWIATQTNIVVFDNRSLNPKKIFSIKQGDEFYSNGCLIVFRQGKIIITSEKIQYLNAFDDNCRLTYINEVKGLLYIKINQLPFLYDLKANRLTPIEVGFFINCNYYWIDNHLVVITKIARAIKFIG